MKVLIVELGTSGKGGSFRSALDLKVALEAIGLEVHIVIVNKSELIESSFASSHIHRLFDPIYSTSCLQITLNKITFGLLSLFPSLTILLNKIIHYRSLQHINKLITDLKINAVHCNNQPNRDFFLTLLPDIKILMHARSLNGDGFTKAQARALNNRVRSVIAVSQSAANYWRAKGIENISIVQNYSKLFKSTNDEVKNDIIYVGRLVKEKGVDTLIRAISILKNNHPHLKVAILGEGHSIDELKSLAKKLDVENQLHFLGYVDQRISYIQQSKILVLPSQREGFGRTLIEAMACEVAVVGSNVEGIKDIIQDKINGRLFEYNNYQELALVLKELLDSERIRIAIAQQGHQSYLLNYTSKVFNRKIKEVYERI